MLFTSSQPSEGKTTTTVNTAISLAHLGASVLIIDADLRRPSTHRVFKVSHTPGLSTFLSRDVELDGLVQELSIPNLSLLPCGPLPPNPSELISSVKMKELLRIASGRYDHVLIDSPPLINVSDALILSTLVDGVILVVQGGRTTRGIVRRARMELTNVGAKIFGVVLNNVDWKRDGYYDAYYYSRYYSADYHSDREGEQASSNGD
jgi:capsular exopolysaccharide synthesis family protein